MNKLLAILNALLPAESAIIPMFVHNPTSQKVVGIVLTSEAIAMQVAQSVAAAQPATSTATPASK